MIRRTLIAAATTAALLSGCASTSTAPAASAAAPLDLYLVRHGQTQWNLDKRLQGSTDNPLDATGRQQAAELQSLAQEGRTMVVVTRNWLVRVSGAASRRRSASGPGPTRPSVSASRARSRPT